MLTIRISTACFLLAILAGCTSQQAFEGLKAGRKAQCLQYPQSEFEDCVDETKNSYHEYREQREEIVGN